MRHLIPGRFDLILFVVMALACGMIVSLSASHDYMLGVLAMPIFLFAVLRGFRQNKALSSVEAEIQSTDASAK
jgi:hypothetical protein